MDAALDAGKTGYQWFLKGVEDFPEHYRYLNYETVAFHTAYPVAVKAYNPDVPGELYPYIAAGQCGDTAYWLLWWNGLLTVSGEGKMQDSYPDYENWEDEPWQFWAKEIKEVVVEEGITRIGFDAFAGHTALEKATIPSTVTYFVSAFEECTSLKEVIIKEGVTKISSSAFLGCTALESIDIPDTVTEIEINAFENCTSLKEIVISEAIEEIGSGAFRGCKNLTRAYICCKKVPNSAFAGCGITELILSDNVTEIGWYAFSGNPLTEVVFPDSITVLSGFDNCDNLTRVVLPKNLEELDYYAFAYCDNLVEVVSSEKMTTIGREAFRECTSLTTLSFAEGLQSILAEAFYDCDSLMVVKLPDSVTYIAERAFRSCDSLREFHMSRDLTSIGYYNGQVFSECENLETVWFYGNAPRIHIALGGGTIIAYYPEDNPTWDSVIGNDYGGTITWVPFHVCSNFEIRDAVEPGCETEGYTGDTYCVKCGELVEKGEVIPATGHTWGDWEIIQEPTEHTPGQKRRTCAVCGSHEDRHIPATGTVFGDVNGDAEINGKDLILLRQSLAGWDVEPVPQNADCNGDGEINGKDLILLRQHLAGWDVTLGPTE
ncbi:MAG: leucine-rich repeat protein [Oscillospiraceae bacterium]|nr:leucine-rich repeat protein [Oscillospiraceae bacterium]